MKKLMLLTAILLAIIAFPAGCKSTTVTSTVTTTRSVTATAQTVTVTQSAQTTTVTAPVQTSTVTKTSTITVTPSPVTLNVWAASSLTKALNEVNTLYTQSKPWITISPNYAASGTLQTGIENGGPADVFFSAAASNMDKLQNENLLLAGTRVNLLNNKIVLIVPKGSTLGITGFSDLTLDKVKVIAIGDPGSVPAGVYAQQAFTELGILSAIQSKFVLGANVTQVLQYVDSGNADAGVVYSTDALSDANVTVIAQGPDDVNASIVYPAAIIKASKNPDTAQDYISFLGSAQAKAIFEKYGFSMASK